MNRSEFTAEFDRRFAMVRSQFFKLERRQSYDVTSDPYFRLWREGKKTQAIATWQRSADFIAEQAELVQPALARGVRLIRVRVYDEPLTEYLKYEFETYRVSARLGQEIRCVKAADVRAAFALTDVADFVMFDDDFAIIDHHDAKGVAHGGYAIKDPKKLVELKTLRDLLIRRSAPCASPGIY